MNKLKVAPGQRISRMSCGQRSQVALGLILAQNPELLVLDDFSLGLDPGYRRLFVDYLRDYARSEGKTVFLTSHIIQDMERLVDDCIIMDYGKILIQKPIVELLEKDVATLSLFPKVMNFLRLMISIILLSCETSWRLSPSCNRQRQKQN